MSVYFPIPEECSRHTIFPGVHIRTCAAEKVMMSLVDIEPHAVVEEHSHPHEQVGMVLPRHRGCGNSVLHVYLWVHLGHQSGNLVQTLVLQKDRQDHQTYRVPQRGH